MEGDDAISGPRRSRFTDVRRVTSTGSTNADVMALARDGEPEGVVLVADHQTAGRGRAGRTWTAPPGASLLCTLLLRPPARVAPLVTFALAVAAAEAVERLAGFAPGLKWPNDLVVESTEPDGTVRTRKLAGILAEAEWPAGANIAAGWREPGPGERATVAAGIGLNVSWPDELPDDLADIAVAVNHVSDRAVTRDEVLEELLDRFDVHYARLVDGDVDAVLDAWRARSATLGREVRIDLGADDVVGTAVDVDRDGHLVVEPLEGGRRTIAVGDVVHLRPAGPAATPTS
ncbi:MAG TPA: biotin--[acetyl-CoA-carboxylase] ligase [Acidimicrobiales bacterium]|nr:biotin--[acetyl-CoA-carboxylase] ligase [Acidimicrobiales bacterium]